MPVGSDVIGNLIDCHARALVLYARQLCDDPDDVVQQALMKLAEQRHPPREPLPWLYKVVRNEALMASRTAQRRRQREHEFARSKDMWFEMTADDATDAERAAKSLESLTQEKREIVTAHIWGRLTFREIGKLMSISDSSAHRRYQEALESLRTEIGESCQRNN